MAVDNYYVLIHVRLGGEQIHQARWLLQKQNDQNENTFPDFSMVIGFTPDDPGIYVSQVILALRSFFTSA
jgi:hypothetical protein